MQTTIIALFSSVLLACSSPAKDVVPPHNGELSKSIFLVSHGWHAGIVLRRADVPSDLWPEQIDFSPAEYVEVGWGDKDYYMTPNAHVGITLKAGLWPTSSVLHIAGFSGSVTDYFPHSEIVRIELSHEGFIKVCKYIEHSYARDESGKIRPLESGLYGNSKFYLSNESYHAFNTCNVWTGRALRHAGYPITPGAHLTVDSLMSHVKTLGVVIQEKAPEQK